MGTTTTTTPPPRCRLEDGWTQTDNLCYKKLLKSNYNNAKSQCQEAGGDRLLADSDLGELDLKEMGFKYYQNVWLYTEEDTCTAKKTKTGKVYIKTCNSKCQVVCVQEI